MNASDLDLLRYKFAEQKDRIMSELSDKLSEAKVVVDEAIGRVKDDVADLQAKVADLEAKVTTPEDLAALEEIKAKLAALASLADLLEAKLKSGRLPGIARRPADAYGGLSMLDMIAADRHDELLQSVRESFEWERAA